MTLSIKIYSIIIHLKKNKHEKDIFSTDSHPPPVTRRGRTGCLYPIDAGSGNKTRQGRVRQGLSAVGRGVPNDRRQAKKGLASLLLCSALQRKDRLVAPGRWG